MLDLTWPGKTLMRHITPSALKPRNRLAPESGPVNELDCPSRGDDAEAMMPMQRQQMAVAGHEKVSLGGNGRRYDLIVSGVTGSTASM
jgi:hypothetical protein